MKRHCPFDALRETEEKARVAVLSRAFDSAAEDGWRVPPAPETGTGVDGLEVSVARIISPAVPAALDAAGAATEDDAAALFVEATAALDAARVTKTVVTELH